MKELNITNAVINGEEQPAVNARELWKALNSKRKFADWIQDRLTDFTEGVDFTVHKIVNGENKGRFAAIEYTLTLDTAKHLCMLERNEQGKKIRQYFIAVEKEYWQMNDSGSKIPEVTQIITPVGKDDLRQSTFKLLDTINRIIISGGNVDREILQYAWNVGRLFNKEMSRSALPDALTDFVMSLASGKFSRNEIYDLYCASCECPVSARRFWPAVRAIRPCDEIREAYKRFVVFR